MSQHLSKWKTLRHYLERLLVIAGSRIVPHLTRTALLTLAKLLGTAAYHLDRRGRRTALENLRVASPGDWPDAQCHEIARASYQNFARTVLDLFWITNLTADNFQRWFVLDDRRPVPDRRPLSESPPSIWVTLHLGNFEWLAHYWSFVGRPLLVVAQDFKNPHLTPIFRQLRSHSGNTLIPQEGAVLRLYRHLRQGGHAAFLTDLTVKPEQAATIIECFGLKTCATRIHADLATRGGLPLTPAFALPLADGRYQITILPEVDSSVPEKIAQRCWDALEPTIREHPENWIWMYKHWRYLPPDTPSGNYPEYANRSKKFDRLLGASTPTA